MQLNTTTVIPSGPNTAYTITRPAGCTPASESTSTNATAFEYLALGTLSTPPKGVSLRVTPVPTAGGHCGIVANTFGAQVISPPVFGAGVALWTHANGILFDDDLNIVAEVWHIDPGTSSASGAWLDTLPIGKWIRGRTYQVDALMYANGAWVFNVYDLTYALDYAGQPDNAAMRRFFSTDASATDPSASQRVRAKSVNGRTNQLAAFIFGAGTTLSVTPIAIFN